MTFFHECKDFPIRPRKHRQVDELPMPAWGDPSFVVHKVVPSCQHVLCDGQQWPEKTDLACLWCEEQFGWAPVGAPVYYNHKKDQFVLKWNFCSFNCCKAWMLEKRMPQVSNVFWLAMRLFGRRTENHRRLEGIQPAPRKEALQKYGGWMSIEEFRSNGQLIRPANPHGINIKWDPVQLSVQSGAAEEMAMQSRSATHRPPIHPPPSPKPQPPPPIKPRPNTLDVFLSSARPKAALKPPPPQKRSRARS